MVATVPVPKSLRLTLKQFGNNLKLARKQSHLTTDFLSKKAGITRVTLSKLEKGDPGVSIGVCSKVLNALEALNGFHDLISSLALVKKDSSNYKKKTSSISSKNKTQLKTKTKLKSVSSSRSRVVSKSNSRIKSKTNTRTKTVGKNLRKIKRK